MTNNYNDPHFLRRQREKREAEKKAKALAAQHTAATQLPASTPLTPLTRQQAIEAKIKELLNHTSDHSDQLGTN